MSGNGKNRTKSKLVKLVREGSLFCLKHEEVLTEKELYQKKCYLSRVKGREYCKYLNIK
jgi:hypothetical protein